MSHNRRTCVSHHKNLDIFHNIKNHTPIPNNNTNNNKRFHATLIHKQWQRRVKKHVYSNRLGISYDISYSANGHKYLTTYNDRRMYRKRLDNFRSHHSDSSKRSKKQKSRFQRACRYVFYNRGKNRKSHRRVNTLEEKLHRARQHRFLFLPSQHVNKPIQHLKYHKKLVLRDEEHYNFPIPPAPRRPLGVNAVLNKTIDRLRRLSPGNNSISTSNTHSPATTLQPILLKEENTWHETLGIWIPNDLFPYVTDEPVYISKRQATLKGRQHAPGSTEWLKVIRNRKKAHESADRQEKERLLREEDLSARAKLWGTSSNSIEYREEMTKDLTKFQEHYHKKITPLIERHAVLENRITQGKNVYKTNKQLLQLERELGVFKIDYFSVIDDNGYHYRYKGHTSDDTKQLELRPHKRPSNLTINIDRHNTEIKKLRLDIPSPEDSKVFASL
ncbi:uncharacterized protein OCT59_007897 [Rhizophagus irregularis]|uniref:DUF8211 domain-containing protein n=3 Tax=Rhizophagus irregularis TaxID=588596 RepID=A0A015L6H7_RHIIW|nr:hypothetical protein RirG_270890 [Rhizophagus irregularis DAOM 197198w]UZO16512.1 hypothetical protein OCT59_007897 [Rhizophagus irregularis]GBC43065.1 hypothetical protein GLOIN_2v1805467 [Rhizophagus irregularis DAOM 181602=DAOM 197198]